MSWTAIGVIQNLVAVAFLALGAATGLRYLRLRERSLKYLALAIVLLSLIVLVGRVQTLTGFQSPALAAMSLAAFLGSGYALLLFRHALLPLPQAWLRAALGALIVSGIASLLTLTPPFDHWAPAPVKTLVTAALIGAWCTCIAEPTIRFWLASNRLPPVQRWRLRSLSLGFGGLVLIILLSVAVGSLAQSAAFQVASQLLILALVPLLYASFAPPSWLRLLWRSGEEKGLQTFLEGLVALDHDEAAVTGPALEWSMRIVGGEAALVVSRTGTVSASSGLGTAEADRLAGILHTMPDGVGAIGRGSSVTTALILPPNALRDGNRLVILGGALTPAIGEVEELRLIQFRTAITAALDRSLLIRRLHDSNLELESANRHKSAFLASMSHELRTPLNAIIGFSELMLDDGEEAFDAATRTGFLNEIHAGGEHLLGLINDLLDLSKIEAGQMQLRLERVDVNHIAEQVAATVGPLASKKNIRLRVDVSGAGWIRADGGKLKQMLLNLMSNAIKFTPEGGAVSLLGSRSESVVRLSVVDTGIGISAADAPRVFQEFQQVEGGSGAPQQGTGLGLALTRRFAQLHGGDVGLESEVGKGSTFLLTLPVDGPEADPPLPEPEAETDAAATGPLVLIVEDQAGAAALLARYLRRGGYESRVASTGREALRLAAELQPVAITLDINLPDVDGWSLMTALKQDRATAGIPILVVTVDDNRELGFALGAVDYFVKPVDAGELLARLTASLPAPLTEPRTRNVLVVDDEPANRRLLAEILEPAGFAVSEAAGGREAIERATSAPPDLVVLDLVMPEVTGFEVVSVLRRHPATAAVPIVILTASDLSEADRLRLEGDVQAVLNRPVEPADLLAWLEGAVGSSPARSAEAAART